MSVLAALPFLLCALVTRWKGPDRALVFVLLPSLLLLPAYYTHKFPGVPLFTFHNYALLITAAAFWRKGERAGLLPFDGLVILYCATAILSELETRDVHEAKNLAAGLLMTVAAPYWIGRICAKDSGRLVGALGMIVLVGALIGWASPWEARMGNNPFDAWRRIWPGSVPWDGALYRGGLRRVAGPFAHPICHGFFFSMALPVALWLADRRLPQRGLERGFILGGLVLGLFTSLSRGPIIGCLVALGVSRVAWSRLRGGAVAGGLALMLFAAPFAFGVAEQYLSVDRSTATTESQETAAYRKEMLERYVEIVQIQPWLGYGRYQIPVVAGLKSIDNQYLFLALTHGLPNAVLFLALMVWSALTLGIRLLRVGVNDPLGRLGWTLVGSLLGAVITQATVFAGTQTAQLVFLFIGMAIGIRQCLGPGQGRASHRGSSPGDGG